jgi:preprotein translocase subunit SecG
MYQVIIVVHVLLGLGVIGLILMQQGKGADAGAAFGSGSSGSVFGAQGAASFLSRTTAILATLFFSTSLTLAILNGQQSKKADLMDSVEVEQKTVDVPLAKAGTANTVSSASDTPVTINTTPVAIPVTATSSVVSDDKKESTDTLGKVDTTIKNSDNKLTPMTDESEKDVSDDSSEKVGGKEEENKKKVADKKSDKKHESEKKKSSDKHAKKHESDADKKDKK